MTLSAAPDIRAPVSGRGDAILTRDALDFVFRLHEELDGERRRLLARRAERQARAGRRRAAGLPRRDARGARARVAGRRRAGRPPGPPGRDHRPRRPQDDDQRPQLRGQRASWPTSRTPTRPRGRTWSRGRRTSSTPSRARSRSITGRASNTACRRRSRRSLVRPRGWHLRRDARGIDGGRSRRASSTSASTSSTTRGRQLERGSGPYLYLPKLESHLEARLWNDVVHARRGPARPRPRHDQGHRPDRDDPRRLRDGRDPLRAARARAGAERRALGLHLQRHQEVPGADRRSAPRPRDGDDDRAVHARVRGAARARPAMARRARDRRDGRVHPEPARPGAQRRARLRRCARTRSARRATASTAPGSRIPDLVPTAREEFDAVLGDRPNQIDRQREDVAVDAAELLDCRHRPAARSPTQGVRENVDVGAALPRLVARRRRRGRDPQPDGGRRHRRDLARAALAVDAPRRREGGRPARRRRVSRPRRSGELRRPAGRARALRARRTRATDFEEFLTLPAYELL